MVEKIIFNKKIYTKQAIENSIDAYSQLADFCVSNDKNYFIVSIDKIDKGVKNVIRDEFCNFVLAELRKA